MNTRQLIFRILQIATVAVFLGRGWQHLYWDAPYRALFWSEEWWSWFVEGLCQWRWTDYVTSPTVDTAITNFTKAVGAFFVLNAVLAAFIRRVPTWTHWILKAGVALLIFLAMLYCKEKFFHLGQFLEYSLQWSTALFLLVWLKREAPSERFILWLKIAIALTFTCHGLYAIGYYPRPVTFLEMTLNILPVTEDQAVNFLWLMGALDFVAAILLFLPRKLAILAAAYCVFWGFMTTIARVWGHFYLDFWDESLLRWVHEAVLRFPHFLLPLVLLILLRQKEGKGNITQ